VLVALLVVLVQLPGRRRGLLLMLLLRVRVLMGLRRGQWRERHLLLGLRCWRVGGCSRRNGRRRVLDVDFGRLGLPAGVVLNSDGVAPPQMLFCPGDVVISAGAGPGIDSSWRGGGGCTIADGIQACVGDLRQRQHRREAVENLRR
jgi:hypothetical protein